MEKNRKEYIRNLGERYENSGTHNIYKRREKMSGWLTKRDVIYLPLAPTLDFPLMVPNNNNEASSLHNSRGSIWWVFSLIIIRPFSLDGHDDDDDNMLLGLIWSGCPFDSSLFIFSLALIAVTLFPSDQPARARATTAQSKMCDTSSRFYKKPAEEEPHIDPSSIADLLRSVAFLFFCRSTLIYRTASAQAVSLSHQ